MFSIVLWVCINSFICNLSDSNKVFDIALLKELEQTRRAVQEAKRMFLGANKGDNPDSDGRLMYKYIYVHFCIKDFYQIVRYTLKRN